MNNAGDIVSTNKVRINGNTVIINTVKVWSSGKIVIAGLVNNTNSIFTAELKDDLTPGWSNVYSMPSKPLKVKLHLSSLEVFSICIATQPSGSVIYSSLTITGQLLWTRESQIDGLTEVVGFGLLSYGKYGLIVNSTTNSKAIVTILEIESSTGNIVSSHTFGNGSQETVGLKTAACAGRLRLLAVSQQAPGKFAIERNIMYSSGTVETKHIFHQSIVDKSISGALDNAGDAMGVCLPQA